MIVAAGTKRKPKLEAVSTAFTKVMDRLGRNKEGIKVHPFEVPSGISSMPLSLAELLEGAMMRAKNAQIAARNTSLDVDFCVGMEGGFFRHSRGSENYVFLQSWAFCLRAGQGYFGSSGAMPVPPVIAAEIYENDAELGLIIDRYGAENDIRSKGGAYAVFSQGLINRQQSFELALLAALTPFFNAALYKR